MDLPPDGFGQIESIHKDVASVGDLIPTKIITEPLSDPSTGACNLSIPTKEQPLVDLKRCYDESNTPQPKATRQRLHSTASNLSASSDHSHTGIAEEGVLNPRTGDGNSDESDADDTSSTVKSTTMPIVDERKGKVMERIVIPSARETRKEWDQLQGSSAKSFDTADIITRPQGKIEKLRLDIERMRSKIQHLVDKNKRLEDTLNMASVRVPLFIEEYAETEAEHRRNHTESVLTKEGWRKKISDSRPQLIENINPDELWAHLQSRQVITTTEKNIMRNGATVKEQVERLLERIEQCDNTSFINFCIELIKTNQMHIVKKYLWQQDWNKTLKDRKKKLFDEMYTIKKEEQGSFSMIKNLQSDLLSAKECCICTALPADYASILADEDQSAINELWKKVSDIHNANEKKDNIEAPSQSSGTMSDQFALSNQAALLTSGQLAMEMGVYVPAESLLESNDQKIRILLESNILARMSSLPGDFSIGPITFIPHGIQFNKSLVVLIILPDDFFADEDDHDYVVRYNKSPTQDTNEWENVTSFRLNEVSGVVIPRYRAAVVFMPHFCDLEVCKYARTVTVEVHGCMDQRGPSVMISCVAYRPRSREKHPDRYHCATRNVRGGFEQVRNMWISDKDPSNVKVSLTEIEGDWNEKLPLTQMLQHSLIWDESFAIISFSFKTESDPSSFRCCFEASHPASEPVPLFIEVYAEADGEHMRNNAESVLTKEGWRKKISDSRSQLIKDIYPDQLLIHLQGKGVITTTEKNIMRNNATREEQVERLLERIEQCENTTFINFCIELIETKPNAHSQGIFVAARLEQDTEGPRKEKV